MTIEFFFDPIGLKMAGSKKGGVIVDGLYELLQGIRICPEKYIGIPSLNLLYAFINGYRHHNKHNAVNDCLDGFNQYVGGKFKMYTEYNWSSIIQYFTDTEKEAFNEFYNLLDEFIKLKE